MDKTLFVLFYRVHTPEGRRCAPQLHMIYADTATEAYENALNFLDGLNDGILQTIVWHPDGYWASGVEWPGKRDVLN